MTPQAFVDKWRDMALKERSASQSHFNDLCRLLGKPSPTDADKTGEWYTFERGADKASGRSGWADVWKRDCFAWEYKGPKKNLRAAYDQLQQYRESLENPPLLVVSDMTVIEVHTNFTNSVKKVYRFELDDLLDPRRLELLAQVFDRPEAFKVEITPDDVTKEAAAKFARLADILRDQGEEPQRAAHYLIRLLFCLFAEDAGLLPNNVFTRLVEAMKATPATFTSGMRQLFGAMATGGPFGPEIIPHFDGGLFDSDDAVPMMAHGLRVLSEVAKLDWSSIEPAIFGTLFERSLDPAKRSQLGAHYTSRDDILLIVEPVLMAPLRRRWAVVREEARALVVRRDAASDRGQRTKIEGEIRELLLGFMREIAGTRVLDPACGSGNFLFVSLKALLDLWKEVWLFAGEAGITLPMAFEDVTPSPAQLYGIEINEYAHELAQVTVWIGYIQWLRDNGFGVPSEPILRPLETIENKDAILAYDAAGQPVEPEWPAAEVIVGNPPFLGNKRMRSELGDVYVDQLRGLYAGRVPGSADLVTFWFERGRGMIERGRLRRAGLLATQAIRSGADRRVLERIKVSGDIFMAWADRPWVVDGAAVRVSMVGFDDGSEKSRRLDGLPVKDIHADLTAHANLTRARRLSENADICFQGPVKVGPFEVDSALAIAMLPLRNPNGRPNSDVVKPWANASDLTGRPRGMYIIDFGERDLEDASLYEVPFEHVRRHVKPMRDLNRRGRRKEYWWHHGETVPGLRRAVSQVSRYAATPRVAKHRLFVWLTPPTLPDSRLYVFARDDDYFFGVLHSRPHEIWSLATSSRHGDGAEGGRPTYNNTTCFETFPFPWSPGHEPGDSRVTAIADAARGLVEKRDRWLNPEGAGEAELKKRTLTSLYNQRPTWLDLAHKRLDAAVFAAYGWAADLGDEEVLERLLALNGERHRATRRGL